MDSRIYFIGSRACVCGTCDMYMVADPNNVIVPATSITTSSSESLCEPKPHSTSALPLEGSVLLLQPGNHSRPNASQMRPVCRNELAHGERSLADSLFGLAKQPPVFAYAILHHIEIHHLLQLTI